MTVVKTSPTLGPAPRACDSATVPEAMLSAKGTSAFPPHVLLSLFHALKKRRGSEKGNQLLVGGGTYPVTRVCRTSQSVY